MDFTGTWRTRDGRIAVVTEQGADYAVGKCSGIYLSWFVEYRQVRH